MKTFEISGKTVVFLNAENATESDAKEYLNYAEEHKLDADKIIDKVTIALDDNGEADISISYVQNNAKIDRIRRITGYLSGSLNSWNDAKKAEEAERVKHA